MLENFLQSSEGLNDPHREAGRSRLAYDALSEGQED